MVGLNWGRSIPSGRIKCKSRANSQKTRFIYSPGLAIRLGTEKTSSMRNDHSREGLVRIAPLLRHWLVRIAPPRAQLERIASEKTIRFATPPRRRSKEREAATGRGVAFKLDAWPVP